VQPIAADCLLRTLTAIRGISRQLAALSAWHDACSFFGSPTSVGRKENSAMANLAVQKIEDKAAKPLRLFQEIENQFEEVRRRAFELFEKRGREFGRELEDWLKAEHEVMGWPAAELSETDSGYKVSMTLFGYASKDVEVTATPSEIIVHAKVEKKKKTQEKKYLWTEFRSNGIYRRFELPEPIDVEKTTASFDNGMLHITAAKAQKAQPKPGEIRAAA
jgi:HSP20 family protein